MQPIQLLIIDDTPSWAEDIELAIGVAARSLNADVLFHFAANTTDARRMARNHCFHGLSIDQNLPDVQGGEVSRDRGREFIGELNAWDPPGFMAIYTMNPNTSFANYAGSKAQIPYIVKSKEDKSVDDEHVYMTTSNYGEYFLKQVRFSYIPRVLALVMESGFSALWELARDTEIAYRRFSATEFQDEEAARDFFIEFSKFRENFNLVLVSVTMGLVSGLRGKPDHPPPNVSASRVEGWLRKHWDVLEGSSEMARIKAYLHLAREKKLSDHYIKACSVLREVRNPTAHENRIFAPEDFDKHLSQIFCFFDMVSWVMRLPLITAPYKRANYLAYTDLNHRQAIKAEMPFQGNVPVTQPGRVFTQIGEGSRLVPLDHGLIAERDEKSNRLRLKQMIAS